MSKPTLSTLKKELQQARNALKRVLADYTNLEKRVAAERDVIVKLALVQVISKFLPTLDNLDQAAKHTKDGGILMVAEQFRQVLESEGIRQIGAIGDKFDPKFHQAVEVVEGKDDDKIVEVLAPGFIIDDQIIRPARVKVAKQQIDKTAEEKVEKASEFGDYA